MSPIRRRTFFGQTSNQRLKIIINEEKIRSDILKGALERGVDISSDFWGVTNGLIEKGLAAKAELLRRQEHEAMSKRPWKERG